MKREQEMIGLLLLFCAVGLVHAQQTAASSSNVVVPPLVNFSGVLTDASGKPLTEITGVTFYLYKDQQGGSPLWIETQNVQPDRTGHYSVNLGSTSSTGLPANLFSSGEAHWLGVQVQGQTEQPRVMLLSVPYAMKAGDAQTVGGLPASAFVLAAPSPGSNNLPPNPGSSGTPTIGGSGTTDFIPLWIDSSGDLGNSAIFQSGTSPTARVGINTTAPAATLDVKGNGAIRGQLSVLGLLSLGPTSTATATKGFNSQATNQSASAFNSSTGKAVNQTFQWQAEPVGNNTSSPSGTLNLLFSSGSTPTETGLNIAGNGQITFASGQIFPGVGTISGVTAGTDLTGGGTTGTVTLNVDTTKIPQLGAANSFVGNQSITGDLSVSANSSTGEVLNITQSGGGDGINVTDLNGFTGVNAVANDTGVSGTANFTGGGGVGVLGSATNGYGVYGEGLSTTGTSVGVYGTSTSSAGTGVYGASGFIGVYGTTSDTAMNGNAAAVEGVATGVGTSAGVFQAGPAGGNTAGGIGVWSLGGVDTTTSGTGGGPAGYFNGGNSTNLIGGSGAEFIGGSTSSSLWYAGSGGDFVGGDAPAASAGYGVAADAGMGAFPTSGFPPAPVAGVAGKGPINPSFVPNGPGVFGFDGATSNNGLTNYVSNDVGVWGDTSVGFTGVLATADNTYALIASNNSATTPALRGRNRSTSGAAPGLQVAVDALNGEVNIGGAGCGANYWGVQLGQSGMSNCNNYTFLGDGTNTFINAGNGTQTGTIYFRINNNNSPTAMTVNNNASVTIATLDVTTKLTKPAGSFKIDHPLDPANKFLYHSFVESPDMKDIYDGVAVLDENGEAVVVLPKYFQALNSDFRYQLTTIGGFAPVYIAQEVANNQFKIAGGRPGIKVSWQVTGIRQDAFANAYRIQVEVEKTAEERGHYLHPELFGEPDTERIGYAAPAPPVYAKGDSLEIKPEPQPVPTSALRRRVLRRPPIQVLPKLPIRKAPAKSPITQASK